MISPFHFVDQMRKDLMYFQGVPFLLDQRYLEDIAKKITEYKEKYARLDQVGKELKQPLNTTNLLYLPQSSESKSRGAILLELGILNQRDDKKYAIWVKVPRNPCVGKPLKYRISVLNDTDDKCTIQQFQSIYRNEKRIREDLKVPPGSLFTKLYPTEKFKDKAVTISRYYPTLTLFSKQDPDFIEKSLSIAKKLVHKLHLLHLTGYVHGNIHPESIYIKCDKDKVDCLLGNLKNVRQHTDRSLVFTPIPYLSFSSILSAHKDLPFEDLLDQDYWSLGCTLFSLVAKQKPFYEAILEEFAYPKKEDVPELAYWNLILEHYPKNKKLLKEKIELAIKKSIPEPLQPLFLQIFSLDPSRPLTLIQILDKLIFFDTKTWKLCLK